MRVLFVTSQWPAPEHPSHSPFVKVEVDALRQAGVDVDVFHYPGQWHPIHYLRAIRKFRRQLRRGRYDLVHVRFGQCGVVGLSQRSLPVIVRFGGSDLIGCKDGEAREPWKCRFLRLVSLQVARRAHKVILPSHALAANLPREDYVVIPAGIDLARFQPMEQRQACEELGLPVDKKLVLFAADPARRIKRHYLAEEAMRIVKMTLPAQLVVASSVPHQEMPLYMNACDVLVLTSQHEGSPNVVKEALACNLPVVSVDVGDVRSRLRGTKECVVCEDDMPHTIAAALLQVLKRGLRPSLRELVVDLDAHAIARRTIGVYKDALGVSTGIDGPQGHAVQTT